MADCLPPSRRGEEEETENSTLTPNYLNQDKRKLYVNGNDLLHFVVDQSVTGGEKAVSLDSSSFYHISCKKKKRKRLGSP